MPEGSRTSGEYQADKAYKPGEWEDWARFEGKDAVEIAWREYIVQHPEISKEADEVIEKKREEIAKKEAEKAGLDVSSSDAPEEPKWDEDQAEPQAA